MGGDESQREGDRAARDRGGLSPQERGQKQSMHPISKATNFFYEVTIRSAFKKPAPNTIPLSGMNRLVKRDYFVIYLPEGVPGEQFILSNISENGYEGSFWNDGDNVGHKVVIPFSFAYRSRLTIVHYFKEQEFRFHGPSSYWWSRLTYLQRRRLFAERFRRWRFGKKSLARASREQVLKHVFQRTCNDRQYFVSPQSLMSENHGELWVFHPDKQSMSAYYRLVLDSLVDSGDLISPQFHYKLAPQALKTLELKDIEDAREKAAIAIQRRMVWLTLALVLVGLISLIPRIFAYFYS